MEEYITKKDLANKIEKVADSRRPSYTIGTLPDKIEAGVALGLYQIAYEIFPTNDLLEKIDKLESNRGYRAPVGKS